eukprot:5235759-Prymnesium_polylepis.1
MDPCQRLILEHGYKALHDAFYSRTTLNGSLTGIFLGFASNEFASVLAASPAGSSVYAATGSAPPIASGRLSFVLALNGPCITVDTACSAALAAAHAGLRAFQLKECSTGLVAGVTLFVAPGMAVSFAVAGMTSPRGRCHTFDARADGYSRGEACGAVTLSTQDVVKLAALGSAIRQDGRSASLTAPNGQAQQGLLMAAWNDAGVVSDELTVLEAHGTGTALGDPIESGSFIVAAVLASEEEEPFASPMAIGGVKANIGHAEPAAGMTGLLKLVLGFLDGRVVPNAQLRILNPHVAGAMRSASSALSSTTNAGLVGLPAQELALNVQVQTGGVSSFGYAGTIVHAVLRQIKGESNELISYPQLHYRRRSFPWVTLKHRKCVSHVNAAFQAPSISYSTCWPSASLIDAADSTPYLLMGIPHATASIREDTCSSGCQAAGAVLDAEDASASSSHATLAVAALMQHLAATAVQSHTVLLTRGALDSNAAYGGALGVGHTVRLEHAALR